MEGEREEKNWNGMRKREERGVNRGMDKDRIADREAGDREEEKRKGKLMQMKWKKEREELSKEKAK